MKILFVYPRFKRHADAHPILRQFVPMNEYHGSPSLGIGAVAAVTPAHWEIAFRDDRVEDAMTPTDADIVAMSFFTPAAMRAMALGDYFRAQGKTVIAGGLFPTAMPDEVQPHVDAVVVGEAEYIWPQLLADFAAGTLRPRYQAQERCTLAEVPVPRMSVYFDAERDGFRPDDYPLQLTRGCNLTCRACILPHSMGDSVRAYALDQVVAQLDTLGDAGKHASLTEDTSWLPGRGRRLLEQLFDHLIAHDVRAKVSYVGTSFPMIRITPDRLLRKAKQAGVDMFYLVTGFDPTSVNAFTGKSPKARQRALDAIKKALDHGIEPYASFLFGADQDTVETVDRVIEFCDEAGVRKAEFAIATPYPGTPEWFKMEAEGRILTRDWSLYNDANCVIQPAQMTPDQVVDGYLRLWREFYATRQESVGELFDDYQRIIQF